MRERTYYVYILTNRSGTLYTGVAGDLLKRVYQHKLGMGSKFTHKYRITRLVHFEETTDVMSAIAREKEIKGWRREKKIELGERTNPDWRDLNEDLYDDPRIE
jgi:putative endonuclease